MQTTVPIACFLSIIRPPGVQFENSLLQIAPVDKAKCPFVRDYNDIAFQLYTKHNPTVYQDLAIDDDEKLFASNIDWHATTVIYFHAFMEMPSDGSGLAVREAYMIRGDTNVIMVDAQRLEAGPWYFTAAENTWYIGRFAAQFIDYMVSRGLDLSRTHLIGHSLGAQAAGVAGSAIKSGRVARITGLDPALPLFTGLSLDQRLDATDAEFVDVIHTDAGIFGVKEPVGHADFYPNGGISPQPGCELEVVIPQHLLLNKCEDTSLGFYTFHLKPNIKPSNTKQKLSRNIKKLHALLRTAKPMIIRKATDETVKVGKYKTLDVAPLTLVKAFDSKTVNFDTDNHTTTVGEFDSNNDARHEEYEDQIMTENKQHDVSTKPNEHERTKHRQPFNLNLDTNTENPKAMVNPYMTVNKWTNNRHTKEETTGKNDNTKTEHQKQNKEDQNQNDQPIPTSDSKSHVIKRQKRFISFFKRNEESEHDNFLFKMLDFVIKHRRAIPVYTVLREINTLVKSANGELNHSTKERNNYIGSPPPTLLPVTYNLELGNENRAVAFMKKLLGLNPKGDRLTITGK